MLNDNTSGLPLVEFQSISRLLNYLRHIGVSERRLERCFEPIASPKPDKLQCRKIPISEYSRVYSIAAAEMQSVKGALPMAAGLGSEHFEFLCFSAVGHSSLGDALDAIRRYSAMTAPLSGFTVDFVQERGVATVAFQVAPGRLGGDRSFVLASKTSALEVLYSLCSWLINKKLTVSRPMVDEPGSSGIRVDKVRRVLGVALELEAEKTAFSFDRALLDSPILQDGASLKRLLDHPVLNLALLARNTGALSETILSLFRRHQRILSVDELTGIFHQSPSTLYRHLKDEGSSYQLIKDRFRSARSIALLEGSDLKVHEIADQLGFKETGSFIRAFKGWTGCTPNEYRINSDR